MQSPPTGFCPSWPAVLRVLSAGLVEAGVVNVRRSPPIQGSRGSDWPAPGRGKTVIDYAGLNQSWSVREETDLEYCVGSKKTGKGRRKIGRKKRRMRSKIRHRKG